MSAAPPWPPRDPRVSVVDGAPICHLAEGPVVDPRTGDLAYIDIHAGQVHVVRLLDETLVELVRTVDLGRRVGAIAPTGDGWLVAVENGFERRDADWRTTWSDDVFPIDGVTRFNDAALDDDGRFYAGTMGFAERPGQGDLYRLDPDGSWRVVVTGVGVSNGIGWSPDRRTMYFTDSLAGVVHAYSYDAATGGLGPATELYRSPLDDGAPDGLTVDAEGGVWIALWDGGRVIRVNAAGGLTDTVHMGVPRPTSLAFAGPGLERLYVTSAFDRLTPAQREAAPDSGRLFTFVPEVPGRAAPAAPGAR